MSKRFLTGTLESGDLLVKHIQIEDIESTRGVLTWLPPDNPSGTIVLSPISEYSAVLVNSDGTEGDGTRSPLTTREFNPYLKNRTHPDLDRESKFPKIRIRCFNADGDQLSSIIIEDIAKGDDPPIWTRILGWISYPFRIIYRLLSR